MFFLLIELLLACVANAKYLMLLHFLYPFLPTSSFSTHPTFLALGDSFFSASVIIYSPLVLESPIFEEGAGGAWE